MMNQSQKDTGTSAAKLRTTIVATLGPATSDAGSIKNLIRAGMSVARINFSHGSYDEHRERVENIRAVSERLETLSELAR